jgi:hypothetical protein
MLSRAKEGSLLEDLVTQGIAVCQEAQRACLRQGPGRKPLVPDWVLAVMIMIAVMLKKKTKSAQYVWWTEHRDQFARWLPGQHFPARSTFFDRYRRMHRLYRQAVILQGRQAIQEGFADARCVAADKSLIAGQGRTCHPWERCGGQVPRGVDGDATWSYSEYDGWVQGYAFEVVVTAAADGAVWPLLASVDTASRSEQKTIREKIDELPEQVLYLAVDSGYDSNAVAEAFEQGGAGVGRHFLCPEVPRPNTGKPRQPSSRQSRRRQQHRRWRERRRRFLQSRRGQALYARRKTCVEPFHAQLKHLFELENKVWHWSLDNNRTMILAAISAYQLLMMNNHRKGLPKAHLQRLLDGL